jgi:phosphatidate cytidylyltransferase
MKRVLTAALLIPAVTYVALWGHWALFYACVIAVAVLCHREYEGLAAAHGIPGLGLYGLAAGLVLLLAPPADLPLLVIFILLATVLAMRADPLSGALPRAAGFALGMIYIFGPWRCAILLRERSPWWLLFALSINWVGDIAAFYVGRKLGRHRLAPRVSPAKSWEGAIASVVFSVIFALVYFRYLIPEVPPVAVAGFAIAGNIAGQAGDLAESAMKRGAGVKDSGTLLPGHGGWLDRLDSSLFSIPVIYWLATSRGL